MIKTLFTYSLGLLTTVFSLVQTCEDLPVFDYEIHPYQPFEFEHLELSATLEPELALVRGVVTYTISAKIDGLTELVLQTEESAIDDVFVNDVEVDFRVSEDSLVIQLPDSSISERDFELAITWQSNSKFGLYLDSESNFWSSKNPLAHRHWFPVFDHPRNELTFEATFTIPLETEILFNGDLTPNAVASANQKKITYSSEIPVPVTGLGFALGDFVVTEVASGLTDIRLFTSETRSSEEKRIELIREASQLKKEVEKRLSMEYPWEGLNIVVLPDNYWEERTHGTGTIFLYENLGSLSNQLKRGLYAQWFGEYHRPEQFSKGDELMKTALHFSLEQDPIYIENPDTLLFIDVWNRWQQSFKKESSLFQNTVKNSLSSTMREMKGIAEFEDYAEVWYDETGIPWFDGTPEDISIAGSEGDEKVSYKVDTFYDESESDLTFVFELMDGVGEELFSTNVLEYTFEDTNSHEVHFTGSLDTVTIKLSPSVEYVFMKEKVSGLTESLEFGEFPLYFLLSQLRSESIEERRIAAQVLSSNSDNPDLQLALNDVMNQEQDPSVIAALLGTMASITDGATGTEQQFLDKLNGEELDIQLASLKALKNYSENEVVTNAIRTKLIRTNLDEIFDTALETYLELATSEEIVSIVQRLQRSDTTGNKSLKVMSNSVNQDSSEMYIPIAEAYLGTEFPYLTQKKAVDFLLLNDSDEERWISRLDNLLENRDPRIRFTALNAVTKLSPSEALKILNAIELSEFDARILIQVENLLEEISE